MVWRHGIRMLSIIFIPAGQIIHILRKQTLFLDNVEECKSKFTYDKFHRVIREEITVSRVFAPVVAQTITTQYTYSGNVSETYFFTARHL